MQIKTASYQNILDSLCKVLEFDEQAILDIINSAYFMFQQDHKILIMDDLYDYFIAIAQKNLKESLDNIFFYNVSRRLDDSDNDGLSLVEVLISDNSLSNYLRNYGLTFKYDQEIEMYVNGRKIVMPEEERYRTNLKYRLTGNYSFKGYAFGDQLENNEIIDIVEGGPEFFGHLFNYVDNDDEIIDNFIEQSQLYKFEYLVPIDNVYFEDYDELTNEEKQYHLIAKSMQRLYFYKYDPSFVNSDEDNSVIGMIDDKTLLSQYLISKTVL